MIWCKIDLLKHFAKTDSILYKKKELLLKKLFEVPFKVINFVLI